MSPDTAQALEPGTLVRDPEGRVWVTRGEPRNAGGAVGWVVEADEVLGHPAEPLEGFQVWRETYYPRTWTGRTVADRRLFSGELDAAPTLIGLGRCILEEELLAAVREISARRPRPRPRLVQPPADAGGEA